MSPAPCRARGLTCSASSAPRVDGSQVDARIAERIRGELQAAIEAQDMARAFQLNKELKQYMMEAGLKYELDGDEEEALPIADDISPFVDSGDP